MGPASDPRNDGKSETSRSHRRSGAALLLTSPSTPDDAQLQQQELLKDQTQAPAVGRVGREVCVAEGLIEG